MLCLYVLWWLCCVPGCKRVQVQGEGDHQEPAAATGADAAGCTARDDVRRCSAKAVDGTFVERSRCRAATATNDHWHPRVRGLV